MIFKRKKRRKLSEELTVQLEPGDLRDMMTEGVWTGASSELGDRKEQQDRYLIYPEDGGKKVLGAVCDGMGGMTDGAAASGLAVELLRKAAPALLDAEDLRAEFRKTALMINSEVLGLDSRSGTTMAVAVIRDGLLHFMSLGDSKIFLMKDGRLKSRTKEHNYAYMAQRLADDPTFTFDPDVRQDALVSYIGAEDPKYIDLHMEPIRLSDGDTVIICSDGLYKVLGERQIVRRILEYDMSCDDMARALTSDAVDMSTGGQDNTTVVVLKYRNTKELINEEE